LTLDSGDTPVAQPFFEENVVFRAPKGFLAAMETLARREYCASVSDVVRRILIARLREEGIPIRPDQVSTP
jgi:hypothetical protein